MSGLLWVLQHRDETDSTNRELVELARQGAPEGLVVRASYQSQGRGRLGRSWEAPADSALLCSVLLRPALGPTDMQWAVVAVALSARSALARHGVACGLKWPNDLVVGSLKLGGVLAEYVSGPEPGVVVGLGVNLTSHPPQMKATDVASVGADGPVGAHELLEGVLEELGARRALLDAPDGRSRLLDEYRAGLVTIGQWVRVQQRDGQFQGRAIEVDSDGCLVVELQDGVRRVVAGDVVHLRRAEQ